MYSLSPVAIALFAIVKAAGAQDNIGFGPAFSLGPTNSWIREANTTLVLPKTPGLKDRLALWPGMGTSGGDLIQALAVSFEDPNANCGASEGQWCTWASTLQGMNEDLFSRQLFQARLISIGTQLGGDQVPANAGDELTMSCKCLPLDGDCILTVLDVYNEGTDEYDQSVAINGEVVSNLSTSKLFDRGEMHN